MFNFCNLYSGSSGNCSLIISDHTKILIDCGVSNKKLVEGLASIGLSIDDISAILVTHEHSDHIKGIPVTCKNSSIPVFANKKTMDALSEKVPDSCKQFFVTNEKFEIGELKIKSFAIPHDAADPVGFTIEKGKKKISVATDIGHMENSIIDNISGSNFILFESNYEPEMLKASRYPYMLKRRILGPYGHLSNEESGDTLSELATLGVKNVQLGHLSQQNNFPELAYKTVLEQYMKNNIDTSKLTLSVADRSKPNAIIKL